MTNRERIKFNIMVSEMEKLSSEKEKIYNCINDLPEYSDGTGKGTIKKLLKKGILVDMDENNLNISETMFKVLVINDRAGMYK